MLPKAAKPDWFVIPRSWSREIDTLRKSPQIMFLSESKAAVHLSHLPLIAHRSEVQQTIAALGAPQISRTVSQDNLSTTTLRHLEALSAAGITPRAHQLDIPRFVSTRRGALIGDQMRVGKTASALLCHEPSNGKLIVVAPLPTREGWLRWINATFPNTNTFVARGKEYDPAVQEADTIFINYDILSYWRPLVTLPIGLVVFDEAHLLSNHTAQRSASALMLATKAQKTLLLSGTPLWNKPVNLWTLCNLIAPGAFGSYDDFGSRYGAPEQTMYGRVYKGVSNAEELEARFSSIQIARSWKDVSDNVPAIERSTETIPLSQAQLDQIDRAVFSVKATPGKGVKAFLAELARYRKALGKVKAKTAIEWLQCVNEPVVVWAWHKEVAKDIAEGCHGYLVTGDTPPEERATIFEMWAKENRPLVMSISVGQVGLDLSHARLALFCEVDWTPAVLAQTEMRVFSPVRPMAVVYLVADHPSEQTMIKALWRKIDNAHQIGVAASEGAIDVLCEAFGIGIRDADKLAALGNLDRLMADALSSQ